LTAEFDYFRRENSVDGYFQKYLSDDTRKQTLKLVDELMDFNEKTDWARRLNSYKD
jgi:hypothetical protein